MKELIEYLERKIELCIEMDMPLEKFAYTDALKKARTLQLQQTGVNGSFLYSIQILEKERNLIKECLSNWEKEIYPEAKKEREQRLKDINNALEKLKYENTGENRNF